MEQLSLQFKIIVTEKYLFLHIVYKDKIICFSNYICKNIRYLDFLYNINGVT